jgi:hypothetical protein
MGLSEGPRFSVPNQMVKVRTDESHRNYCAVEWSGSSGMFAVEIQIFYKSA